MTTCHFDPFSGISGDMTLGALFDAGVPTEPVLAGIASLGLPVELKVEKVRKGGFAATRVKVEAPHEHKHRHLPDIEAILSKGALSDKQRNLALRIFRRLAQAEADAHGIPLNKVHFHEVGALDSIADIAGASIALDLLGAETFTSGPVAVGTGTVKCAHGVMPIPTPGTAALLKGVPLLPCSIAAELTTPTGAAILATVVTAWHDTPPLRIEHIGHGAGTKDFPEQPNLLRIFVGQASAKGSEIPGLTPGARPESTDVVFQLETNLDDVPGEIIGYCFERLFAAGALDVWTTSIQMKKNRPGVLLGVLAAEANLAAVEEVLFRETGTLGIRRTRMERSLQQRREAVLETPWGTVRGKHSWREGHPPAFSPEFDDCARIARDNDLPLHQVLQTLRDLATPREG